MRMPESGGVVMRMPYIGEVGQMYRICLFMSIHKIRG
jgi:hypothetical protein